MSDFGLIDAGGARWYDDEAPLTPGRKVIAELAQPHVVVVVTETHDGVECDCVNETMRLTVGQTLELTHTCHDGRVDKVVAVVHSIHLPPPRHEVEHVRVAGGGRTDGRQSNMEGSGHG